MVSGRRIAVLIAALALAGGCRLAPRSCAPGEPAALLRVTIRGGARINRDEASRALPTWVRVYQLRSGATFERAGVDALWGGDAEVLGAALVGVVERPVHPGEGAVIEVPLAAEATMIGAAALFRRPAGSSWRGLQPLPRPPRCAAAEGPPAYESIEVVIEDSALRIGAGEPAPRPGAPKRKRRA